MTTRLTMIERESLNLIQQFVTLLSLIYDKKITVQKAFILFLTEPKINEFARKFFETDSDYEIGSYLLLLDPNLTRSKVLLKYKKCITNG